MSSISVTFMVAMLQNILSQALKKLARNVQSCSHSAHFAPHGMHCKLVCQPITPSTAHINPTGISQGSLFDIHRVLGTLSSQPQKPSFSSWSESFPCGHDSLWAHPRARTLVACILVIDVESLEDTQ
jgi:hypothetical protein